jgi:hypothetical protein
MHRINNSPNTAGLYSSILACGAWSGGVLSGLARDQEEARHNIAAISKWWTDNQKYVSTPLALVSLAICVAGAAICAAVVWGAALINVAGRTSQLLAGDASFGEFVSGVALDVFLAKLGASTARTAYNTAAFGAWKATVEIVGEKYGERVAMSRGAVYLQQGVGYLVGGFSFATPAAVSTTRTLTCNFSKVDPKTRKYLC